MIPETIIFEGKTVKLQEGRGHGYNQVILLKSGIIGRRERSMYPDWFKGFYCLKIGETNKEFHRFHVGQQLRLTPKLVILSLSAKIYKHSAR